MKKYCMKLFPALKRWKCSCTNKCAGGYNPDCTCENPEYHCREKIIKLQYIEQIF